MDRLAEAESTLGALKRAHADVEAQKGEIERLKAELESRDAELAKLKAENAGLRAPADPAPPPAPTVIGYVCAETVIPAGAFKGETV